MSYKEIPLEEWESIGEQSKTVKNDMEKLLGSINGRVPVKILDQLLKTMDQFHRFKCLAEDRMIETHVSNDPNIFP